jgi:hypothetical protein
MVKPSGKPVAVQVPAIASIGELPAVAVFAIDTGAPTRALARGDSVVTAGAADETEKLIETGAAAPKLKPFAFTSGLLATRVQIPAPTIVTTLLASTVQTEGVLEVTIGLMESLMSETGNSGNEPASGRLTPGVVSAIS